MSRSNMTSHGKRRMKERVGANIDKAARLTGKAYTKGVDIKDTRGKLRQYLLNKTRVKAGKNRKFRVYAGKIYIFYGATLITVLNIPSNIGPIEHNLTAKGYEQYIGNKVNRYKDEDDSHKFERIHGMCKNYIIRKGINCSIHEIKRIENNSILIILNCKLCSDDDKSIITRQLSKKIKSNYPFETVVIKFRQL